MSALDPHELTRTIDEVSLGGRFEFTRDNLLFALARRGAWPEPTDVEAAREAFVARLAAHEREHGPLDGLVRTELLAPLPVPAELPPDVLDYAVRRVIVFDRVDTCLLFVRNGFHRRIEVGLVAWPDFPAHVWARLRSQLDDDTGLQLLLFHDARASAAAWCDEIREAMRHPAVNVEDAGLSDAHAAKLRLPRRGDSVSLHELTPAQCMRWVYRRVARGHDDVGFG